MRMKRFLFLIPKEQVQAEQIPVFCGIANPMDHCQGLSHTKLGGKEKFSKKEVVCQEND